MYFGLLGFRSLVALIIAGIAGTLACRGQGQGAGPSRNGQASESPAGVGATKLGAPGGKKDRLKELEEDLYKPLQAFQPGSSLDGVLLAPSPLYNGRTPSKREEELREQRRDWVFLSQDDLLNAPTAKDLLGRPENGGDGQDKETLSPLEQFFFRDTQRSSAKKMGQAKTDDMFGKRESSQRTDGLTGAEDANLPAGLSKSEEDLMGVLKGTHEAKVEQASSTSFADIFGLGRDEPTKEEKLAHKLRMDEFRRVLDPSWQPAANDPASALASVFDAAAPGLNPLPGFPASATHNRAEASSIGISALPLMQDLGSKLYALPSLTPTAPAPEPARAALPPPPTFSSPRRAF